MAKEDFKYHPSGQPVLDTVHLTAMVNQRRRGEIQEAMRATGATPTDRPGIYKLLGCYISGEELLRRRWR